VLLKDDIDVAGMPTTAASIVLGGDVISGAFAPGAATTYEASTTAKVISTAADATLAVSDPGHLTTARSRCPSRCSHGPAEAPRRARVRRPGRDRLQAGDRVRRRAPDGTYAKTLTFTLSTTNP
jgi:hypothetical protein